MFTEEAHAITNLTRGPALMHNIKPFLKLIYRHTIKMKYIVNHAVKVH